MRIKAQPKKVKDEIIKLFDNKCGYCGFECEKLVLDYVNTPNACYRKKFPNWHKDKNNIIAACFDCKKYRNLLSIESFKQRIFNQGRYLEHYYAHARRALKYGLIKIVEQEEHNFYFYFEKHKHLSRREDFDKYKYTIPEYQNFNKTKEIVL